MSKPHSIVILGGGFGGAYTAMHLQSHLRKRKNFEVTLVNRENYFVFQPMLAEVVGGSLDLLDTINPLIKLLTKITLYVREIEAINIKKKKVILAPKFTHKTVEISFDHLILALGNVTDFRGMPGLHEHALPFKNLSDALTIRNQLIDVIEAASCEANPTLRKQVLTFVVGGGGFSGTEVVAEINDFVRKIAKRYQSIDLDEIHVVLAHSKDRLMDRELSPSLGQYAGTLLQKRGVDIRFNVRLIAATPEEAILDTGERICAKTIISTVPSFPHPLIEGLNLAKKKGIIVTNEIMQAEDRHDISALGDCAAIPNPHDKGIYAPTAQFAIRQAKLLAKNVLAEIEGLPKRGFCFQPLGMMGALGHHSAVAEIFGKLKFSGIVAWLLWRLVYLMKLPGMDRKVKVALSWVLDTIIPIEAVQIKTAPSQGIAQLHFESGEIIFHEGDVGDYLYIIVKGEVEVFNTVDGKENRVAQLSEGEYFGEMALLNQRSRLATVRCLSPVNVLALKKSDFGILIANFAELKKNFQQTDQARRRHMQ